ncbi:hypothetical protein CDCA_CDCA12G3414 [Cyanidium caldarium]|uniref:Uncharacterized protein n=1 Tax=Cyanidium caldarium TaxID=2771 RepID=A0AAV9IYR7_CYACA|nr:hypothetical protein CDCA_CDCA12G3414 [Cyanidium caldarium]
MTDSSTPDSSLAAVVLGTTRAGKNFFFWRSDASPSTRAWHDRYEPLTLGAAVAGAYSVFESLPWLQQRCGSGVRLLEMPGWLFGMDDSVEGCLLVAGVQMDVEERKERVESAATGNNSYGKTGDSQQVSTTPPSLPLHCETLLRWFRAALLSQVHANVLVSLRLRPTFDLGNVLSDEVIARVLDTVHRYPLAFAVRALPVYSSLRPPSLSQRRQRERLRQTMQCALERVRAGDEYAQVTDCLVCDRRQASIVGAVGQRQLTPDDVLLLLAVVVPGDTAACIRLNMVDGTVRYVCTCGRGDVGVAYVSRGAIAGEHLVTAMCEASAEVFAAAAEVTREGEHTEAITTVHSGAAMAMQCPVQRQCVMVCVDSSWNQRFVQACRKGRSGDAVHLHASPGVNSRPWLHIDSVWMTAGVCHPHGGCWVFYGEPEASNAALPQRAEHALARWCNGYLPQLNASLLNASSASASAAADPLSSSLLFAALRRLFTATLPALH